MVPELAHIRLSQIQLNATQCKVRRRSGVVAYVLPKRFRGGMPVEVIKRGDCLFHYGLFSNEKESEILYSLHFMVPRFLNLDFRTKMETIVHELYHIHPDFNGDLRRFKGGRLHGPTEKAYAKAVRSMTDVFLRGVVDAPYFGVQNLNYGRFVKEHGPILTGARPRAFRPRLIKVERPEIGQK